MKKYLIATALASVLVTSACSGGDEEDAQEESGGNHGEKQAAEAEEVEQPQEEKVNGVHPDVDKLIASGHEKMTELYDQGWSRADFNIEEAKNSLEKLIPEVGEAAELAEDSILTEDLEEINSTMTTLNDELNENMEMDGMERHYYFVQLLTSFRDLDHYIRGNNEYEVPNTTNYAHEELKQELNEGETAEAFEQLSDIPKELIKSEDRITEAFVQNDVFRQTVMEADKQSLWSISKGVDGVKHSVDRDIDDIYGNIVRNKETKKEALQQLN